MMHSTLHLLAIEPFDAGSHAAFFDTLLPAFPQSRAVRMPGRHWKWRMRGSAAWLALQETERLRPPPQLLLASSYFPLAEFRGLCPELARTPCILYFHENQIAFPDREGRPEAEHPDLHFAFTQLVSALAADLCLFNSRYNRDSFLEGSEKLLARMPDRVPAAWIPTLREHSEVLHYPVPLTDFRVPRPGPSEPSSPGQRPPSHPDGPLILWNHRWEHDKNPEEFFAALESLAGEGVPFRLAVCGHRFARCPAVFDRAEQSLASRIVHFGTLPDRAAYCALLTQADLVVSTAWQEFFGVSVVEAVAAGARPLVPDRLAYRELWPEHCRYPEGGLLPALRTALTNEAEFGARAGAPGEGVATSRAARRAEHQAWVRAYDAELLLPRYMDTFERVARR